MSRDFDICVIGSGAGGGPVALSLAEAGYSVVVLEKGPWFTEADFTKDELACCRRSVYTPALADEQHVIEEATEAGWEATPTAESGWDFWNGNCVGGSSNFMSGYFYRLKPDDFRLRSRFGPLEGANVADWPIGYEDLEPWYRHVEEVVGVSGRVVKHPHLEPRSTPDYPFPPTTEHPVAGLIDEAATRLGFRPLPVARAILPHPALGRQGCSYSGYCGSYGCNTGAKGSARAALLDRAVATGRCRIVPHAKVQRIATAPDGRITAVEYVDREGTLRRLDARIYVVACQAVETARLLLLSAGPAHPRGLANRNGQVGRNLLFSAGGSGGGILPLGSLDPERAAALRRRGPFVNRGLQDWYFFRHPELGEVKGGTIDFLLEHPNAIVRANRAKWGDDGLLWGKPLKRRLERIFNRGVNVRFEVFCDWMPVDDCFVTLDPAVRDRWGAQVARIRVANHPHDLRIGAYLAEKGEQVLRAMGAEGVHSGVSGDPPTNLMAGGCRFGDDPATSVLDPECRTWEVENLFVTDGSFMPTGGSVPYTFTIYANSFRVARAITAQLGGPRSAA